jgi:hypothetical protein
MSANISVGAKHDRSQYRIITNNLYAVMLRPLQKTRCTLLGTAVSLLFNLVHLNLERAKHFGRQFISDKQRFTAEMLRPYEDICKNGMLLFNQIVKRALRPVPQQ